MSNLSQVNRRFCVMSYQNKPLLCIPAGYFAGQAFEDGKARSYVSGESFGYITGDDDFMYKNSKFTIGELTDDEIQELLKDERLCDKFIERAKEQLSFEPIRPTEEWGLTLTEVKERWCV